MGNLNTINRSLYEKRKIAKHYGNMSWLFESEKRLLETVSAQILGKPLLDVGVGGGRTTPHLLKLSGDYLGIDYSGAMIEQCREKYPDVNFQVMDARDLSALPQNHFALILFSYNGIDYVRHEERLAILGEFKKLLAPDGILVFSSHNLLWEAAESARLSLKSQIVGAIRALHRRMYLPEGGKDYEYRIDGAFNKSLITYYISSTGQKDQLDALGYKLVSVIDNDGAAWSQPERHTASPWLYYVARNQLE